LVTRLEWMLVLVYLEIVLILTQDRCTVCIECTIGSKLYCTHPM
jgi:adenine C2-methylase RlmN of 23S rRNA A2503 and tRNA A37